VAGDPPPTAGTVTTSSSPTAGRPEVATVYAIGLFQGLSLVAFPAAATILTSPSGYNLSKSQYGLLFLPQVVMAIAGSLALPTLTRRFQLKHVLLAGLVADTVAMGLLVGSEAVNHDGVAYPMLLVATASLGLGFGLTLGAISTYAGAFMPDRRDVALTALNVLLGLGTALSPFLIALFTDIGQWWYLPVVAAVGLAALFVLALVQPMALPPSERREGGTTKVSIPALFWLFAGALVIYGVGETMFGNWGTTLLHGRGVTSTAAEEALAVFWLAVTLGRLAIAVVATRISSTRIYVVLPWAMAVALAVAPVAKSAGAGIAVFAFGGLACSGFFPMTVGYGEATFPTIVELAAGWLIAAYQLGYGLAAFGAGALQNVISLSAVFRLAAVLVAVMGVLAIPIAHRQHVAPRRRLNIVPAASS
jgi:MFS transporter, FHS family, glucose/mannose:H+ symporter